MSMEDIETPVRVQAAHRYEVVDIMSRLHIAGSRYHFIGAGGVGMSGLARLLLAKQAIVTGSDQVEGAATRRLNGLGAHIYAGHKAENLDPMTDVVVISAAIRENNPELQRARQRGCRVVKYAQLLGELMNHFQGIAVGGTHGKSTTSGWLVWCLKQLEIDANFVVGAQILQLGGSSGSGDSDVFVVEACEYDRSFHNYKPAVACVLNIERDHLDCYPDEEAIVESFYQFARGTRDDGLIVANGDDPNVRKMLGLLMKDDGSLMIEEKSASSACHHPSIVTFGLDPVGSEEAGRRPEAAGCRESQKTSGWRPQAGGPELPASVPSGLQPAAFSLPSRLDPAFSAPSCHFSAQNVREVDGFYHFDVFRDGRPLGETRISLPGLHNVRNALAVIAMGVSIGVEPERLLAVLDGFQGMERRLMLKGRISCRESRAGSEEAGRRPEAAGCRESQKASGWRPQAGGPELPASVPSGPQPAAFSLPSTPDPAFSDPAEGPGRRGITVLDDYAHHPTEIRASLAAIRQRYRPARLWCVFQAHQYSRTQVLLDEFAGSFADADKVILPEIYPARDSQASREAVNAKILADRIRQNGTDAEYVATFDAVCDHLEKHVNAGDVVVTMGAGDIWKVADEYIQRLRRNR